MNICTFIPARKNSKSIIDKNIKLLGNKPLLVWSIESAYKAGLEKIVVSTDSDEYAKIAYEAGAEVLKRPENLGKDTTSMFDLLKSEVFKIKPLPELVLLLQPTSPLRKSIHIKTAISYLTENLDKYDSIISVNRIPSKYHPAEAIISTQNGKGMIIGKLITLKDKIKSFFTGIKYTRPSLNGVPISQRLTRRQNYPDAWVPSGEIYLFRPENLKKGSIYGDNVLLLETEESININEPSDWELAENFIKEKYEKS